MAQAATQDAASAQVLTNLKRAYPATTFTSVGPSAIPGVYEVLMGRNVLQGWLPSAWEDSDTPA